MPHLRRYAVPLRRSLAGSAALVLVGALAACGGGDSSDQAEAKTLTVYAAASLKPTFTELGKTFESSHEGVTVKFGFGGSSDLVTQIQEGAPADVFASADTKNMDKATADDLVEGKPVDFASNTLEIAVPPDNPASVGSFADLTKSGVKLVICAAEVPCGSAAQKVAKTTRTTLKPVSEEGSVTDVLSKVQTGEADAGLVYVTDVEAAGAKVEGIEFPEADKAVNTYPIATLADAKNEGLAQEFVDLVTGATGQKVLDDAGFAKP